MNTILIILAIVAVSVVLLAILGRLNLRRRRIQRQRRVGAVNPCITTSGGRVDVGGTSVTMVSDGKLTTYPVTIDGCYADVWDVVHAVQDFALHLFPGQEVCHVTFHGQNMRIADKDLIRLKYVADNK